jgi:hypothetical protein
MLGDPEGDKSKIAAIEDQALALMDLPDSAIKASLQRLGMDDEDEEEESKKASSKVAAVVESNTSRIARLERILIRLANDDGDEDDDGDDDGDDDTEEESKKAQLYMDDDAMFEQMLEEEGMGGGMDDDAMFEQMLGEEGMGGGMDGGMDEPAYMDDMADPMGVMDVTMDDAEMAVLAKLHTAGDDEDEEEESKKAADDEEEADEEESKKASAKRRPQPKKASSGARKLGGPVSKAAASEIGDLESIWESAPDISRHFS